MITGCEGLGLGKLVQGIEKRVHTLQNGNL